jgi:rhodanese-related sulfurtransferase
MKLYQLILLIALIGVAFAGFGYFFIQRGAKQANCPTSMETVAEKALVVNVLDPEYYVDGHIAGSINVPYTQVEKAAEGWDKSRIIVTYCTNYQCTASMAAAQLLKNRGFVNARAYEGGVVEWKKLHDQDPEKYPFEGTAKQGYYAAPNEAPKEVAHDPLAISAEELSRLIRVHNSLQK